MRSSPFKGKLKASRSITAICDDGGSSELDDVTTCTPTDQYIQPAKQPEPIKRSKPAQLRPASLYAAAAAPTLFVKPLLIMNAANGSSSGLHNLDIFARAFDAGSADAAYPIVCTDPAGVARVKTAALPVQVTKKKIRMKGKKLGKVRGALMKPSPSSAGINHRSTASVYDDIDKIKSLKKSVSLAIVDSVYDAVSVANDQSVE